jgi:hypothetical protein
MMWGLSYDADVSRAANDAKTTAEARRAISIVQNRWLTDDVEDEPDSLALPVPESESDDKPTKRKGFADPAAAFDRVRSGNG